MGGVVWDYSNSKQKADQYKQKISPQIYKTQVKILAYPGLGYSSFEQPPRVELPERLGGGVRPTFQNPYPIYDQNLRFLLPFLWPDQKFDSLFMTVAADSVGLNISCEGLLLTVSLIMTKKYPSFF